jgi:hypothetical protein
MGLAVSYFTIMKNYIYNKKTDDTIVEVSEEYDWIPFGNEYYNNMNNSESESESEYIDRINSISRLKMIR